MKVVDNKIVRATSEELAIALNNIDKKTTFIVELDGKNIFSDLVFIDEMQSRFKLPDTHHYRYSYDPKEINWHAFHDRMTELSWFSDETNFILIIYNFGMFLNNNMEEKAVILRNLNNICFYWQEEVVYVVEDGEARGFNVYLVE